MVGIACFPFTIVVRHSLFTLSVLASSTDVVLVQAGVARLQVVVLKDAKNKKAHEQSAQQACEAAGAIRTVASLNRENECCDIYSRSLDLPQQISNRTAIYSNAYFSISQSCGLLLALRSSRLSNSAYSIDRLSFFVIGLIFYYGSRQLVAQEVSSTSFFVTMISIVFASIQVGNVFNFVPDMSKARGAANDVVNLFALEPEIDADSTTGAQVVGTEGTITFESELN